MPTNIGPFDSGPIQIQLVGYSEYQASDWTQEVAKQRKMAVLIRIGNLYLQYNSVLNNTVFNVDSEYPNAWSYVHLSFGNSGLVVVIGVYVPRLRILGHPTTIGHGPYLSNMTWCERSGMPAANTNTERVYLRARRSSCGGHLRCPIVALAHSYRGNGTKRGV